MDDRHDWFCPEDMFGPIAGERECKNCGARFVYIILDRRPPENGCPDERGRVINRAEVEKTLMESDWPGTLEQAAFALGLEDKKAKAED